MTLSFPNPTITGTMKALVSDQYLSRLTSLSLRKSFSKGSKLREIPVPAVSDNKILVNIHAVALNPAESKHIDAIQIPICNIGCDAAGEIAGEGQTAASLESSFGDGVAGAVRENPPS